MTVRRAFLALAAALLAACSSGSSSGGPPPPTCADGAKNAAETDVDCGGPTCGPCADGLACLASGDCASGDCTGGVCQVPPTCADGAKNADETDVDCGGPTCATCPDGLACLAPGDCASGVCAGDVCQVPPTCADGAKNAAETDVDCGGPTCGTCADGLACLAPGDCASAICTAGTCSATCPTYPAVIPSASCGAAGPPCAAGLACTIAADCASGVCTAGACQAPSCGDGVKNGRETDVDCGGGCASCAAGKTCLANSDCRYAICTSGVCGSGSGGTVNQGTLNLGNLVNGTVIIRSGPSDPCPATLSYTYLRTAQTEDVYTQLRAAATTGNVAPALDTYLAIRGGQFPTSLGLLTENQSSPPGFIFYTWAGQSRFQVPTSVNGYDPASVAQSVLGLSPTASSDTLTSVGNTRMPLSGQQYVGTGSVTGYLGAADLTGTVTFTPASPPSSATATPQGGGGILLAWTNPGEASFASVAIYRSTAPGSLGTRLATTASAAVASYQDAAVTSGTTYYYTLHSIDSKGSETPNADQVWATAP